MKKRLLSIFLIVCLCAALLPAAALAEFDSSWQSLNNYVSGKTGIISLPAGKYYLSADLTLGNQQDIRISGVAKGGAVTPCEVTIDLNGHVLRGKTGVSDGFIKIFSGGHLTLQDSDPKTSHTLQFQSGDKTVDKTVTGGAVLTSAGDGDTPSIDYCVIELYYPEDKRTPCSLTLKGGTICGGIWQGPGGSKTCVTTYADGGTVLGEMQVGRGGTLTRSEGAADYTTFTGGVYVGASGGTVEDAAKLPVTFNANGGAFDNGAGSVVLRIIKGQELGKPDAEPTKAGCTFGGWYNGDTEWDGSTVVTAPMTFKAKWEEIPTEDEQPDENPDGVGGLVAILDDVPFVDVDFNDYFYDSVKWAYHSGVTGGTDAWHFSPDAGCTRAQAVTFLWRAAGCPSAGYLGNFTDVDADAYYAPAVAWAVANGVTNGTSASTFSPEAACSRGDIVTFLYRAFGGVSNGYTPFTDVPANAYYADAAAWAYEHNVTGGTSADKFSPADACTRAQIVTFLYRVLG